MYRIWCLEWILHEYFDDETQNEYKLYNFYDDVETMAMLQQL